MTEPVVETPKPGDIVPEWSFDGITKLGAIAAGMTALAVFVGYDYERAYFSALGANWYLSSLSSATIMQEGAIFLGLMGTFVYLSIGWLSNGTTQTAVTKRSKWILLCASLLMFGTMLAERWMATRTTYLCVGFGSLLMACSAGVTAGSVFHQTRGNASKWSRFHTAELWWVYTILVCFGPGRLGDAQAAYHLDPTSDGLVTVTSTDPNVPRADRRLVHLEGDTALVVVLEKGQAPEFQIVKLGPTFRISSSLAVQAPVSPEIRAAPTVAAASSPSTSVGSKSSVSSSSSTPQSRP